MSDLRKGGIHHLAMNVFDFDKTVEFYVKGLGFKKGASWGEGDSRAIMLDSGNSTYLEIFAGGENTEKPEGSFIHIALTSYDCDKDIKKAKKAGANITMEPTDVDVPSDTPMKVRIAFCKGLNGEIIEFFQER
jgi:glyoxylase I family protein